jgi:hypothetical protein
VRLPRAAAARRRRLAFTYVPAFTVGGILCTAAGPALNGGWTLGALLMIAAAGGVLLDLEPRMTEQPAERVVLPTGPTAPATVSPILKRATALLAPPVAEQVWLGNINDVSIDTPQGSDPEFAQAFDSAHDAFDACGDALDNGDLVAAKRNALNLVGRISKLQALTPGGVTR